MCLNMAVVMLALGVTRVLKVGVTLVRCSILVDLVSIQWWMIRVVVTVLLDL